MPFDVTRAVDYAKRQAHLNSLGRCAEYVREAIERGGVSLPRTSFAKDYGPPLQMAGFYEVDGQPQKGDVVVIQPAPGNPYGHMAIFDGTHWISDFIQLHGLYPGPSYRAAKPAYKLYRHP